MSPERRTGWEEADRWFRDGGTPPPEGGGGEEAPPPEPRCAVCGAELEPDQTYCLECGSPTPLAPRLSRPRTALFLAGAMVVLGIGAGALALAVASGDGDVAEAPPTVTSPTAPTVPPPDTGATGPLPPDTSFTDPFPPPTAPPAPPTDTGFDTVTSPTTPPEPEPAPEPEPEPAASDWPAGETAWTAVLASVRSQGDAQAAKARVRAGGEPAGVLLSSDHPGMRPGYYVVFSGVFDARATALAQAAKLRARHPGAYARRISG